MSYWPVIGQSNLPWRGAVTQASWSHRYATVTKQYNLVLASGRQPYVAYTVTVGLAGLKKLLVSKITANQCIHKTQKLFVTDVINNQHVTSSTK